MNDSFKNPILDYEEQQYLKEMRKNNLLFDQKLQKLKQKASEFIQKENNQNNIRTVKTKKKEKNSSKIENNYQTSMSNYNNNRINNTSLDISKQESNEIKSVFNKEYNMNNMSNISFKDFFSNEDDILSNINMNKENKIKELTKKNQELKNELDYKNKIIESLEMKIESLKEKSFGNEKIEEMNFELGHLTREVEEKNQKIENYEINLKNLNFKLENLILQNKNLTNKDKKLTDKNDYLMSTLDKMKEENETNNKKMEKLEKLNKNLLKDYEELNNDFNQIKNQKEKIESLYEEQKRKISDLTKEVKDLRTLLKNYLDKNNSENEEENENENIKVNLINNQKSFRTRKNMKYNDPFTDNEIKNEANTLEKNQFDLDSNLSDRYRKSFDYKQSICNSSNNKRYSNRFSNTNYRMMMTKAEEENKLNEDINIRSSSLKQRHKRNYFDTEIKENKYNGSESNYLLSNDGDKKNHLSSKNIFGTKRKLGEINHNNIKKLSLLSSKKIKDSRTKQYFDYEGYEGFNYFPCERPIKKNKKEIDELNIELNQLLKSKNLLESNINKLPAKIRSINGMRQKRDLNIKIKTTENKINEIRLKIKKLMKS